MASLYHGSSAALKVHAVIDIKETETVRGNIDWADQSAA